MSLACTLHISPRDKCLFYVESFDTRVLKSFHWVRILAYTYYVCKIGSNACVTLPMGLRLPVVISYITLEWVHLCGKDEGLRVTCSVMTTYCTRELGSSLMQEIAWHLFSAMPSHKPTTIQLLIGNLETKFSERCIEIQNDTVMKTKLTILSA